MRCCNCVIVRGGVDQVKLGRLDWLVEAEVREEVI